MKYLILGILGIILIRYIFFTPYTNNVCKTFDDYYTDRDKNENCYHNPDQHLSAPEIITRHGYPLETHYVTTEDGYILTLFRIPHGKKSQKDERRKPVFLQHGYGTNSVSFLSLGKKSLAVNSSMQLSPDLAPSDYHLLRSMAHGLAGLHLSHFEEVQNWVDEWFRSKDESFYPRGTYGYGGDYVTSGFILADEGYDVWFGNFRGCKYSLNHTNLDVSDKEYWNFTQHEYGIYDLDVQIDFVWNHTNQKIIFLGFSMGTISIYIYSSTYPTVASEKIDVNINLAPSTFLIPGDSYLRFAMPYWPYIKKLIFYDSASFQDIVKYFCFPHIWQLKFCLLPVQMTFGFNQEQHDPETLPISLVQQLDYFPFKPFDHMMQMLLSGNFQQYDHGPLANRRLYGSNNPPKYNLLNVKVSALFFRAKNDLLATKEGVEKLYGALPNDVTTYDIRIVEAKDFSHLDFVMGKDVVPLVYDHIVAFLRMRSNMSKTEYLK